MIRAIRRLLVAVTAAPATTCVLLPSAPAHTAGPTTTAYFNNPDIADQRAVIQDRIADLIKGDGATATCS